MFLPRPVNVFLTLGKKGTAATVYPHDYIFFLNKKLKSNSTA